MPNIVARKYQRIKAFNEMRNGDRFFTHDQLVDLGVTEKQIDKLMRVFFKKKEIDIKNIYIDIDTYVFKLLGLANCFLEFCSMYIEIYNSRKKYAKNKITNQIKNHVYDLKNKKKRIQKFVSEDFRQLLIVSELSLQDVKALDSSFDIGVLPYFKFKFSECNVVQKNNTLSIKECINICEKKYNK